MAVSTKGEVAISKIAAGGHINRQIGIIFRETHQRTETNPYAVSMKPLLAG